MAGAARTFRVATVQFGPFSVPMGIQGAVEEEDAGLINLCTHDDTKQSKEAPSRIKRTDYCPTCKSEEKSAWHKGREVGGAVVLLDTTAVQSLAATEEEKTTIPLTVHPAAELVGAFPSGKSYFLAPRKGFESNYALMAAAMAKHPEVGFIGEFSFGGAPSLFQVGVTSESVITMRQLARPESLRQAPAVPTVVDERHMTLAEATIAILMTPYDPASYRNRRTEALAKLMEAATPIATADGPVASGGDLGAALLAFVAKHQVEAAPAAKPTRRAPAKKAAAARLAS